MKVLAKSRRELWVSIALVVLVSPLRRVRPLGYEDVLVLAGATCFALVCAVNAVLAWSEMRSLEKALAVVWLAAVGTATPLVRLWASVREFGDK